ncbi:MAG: DUF4911 domain-containing protein [Desulfoplanes sp.]
MTCSKPPKAPIKKHKVTGRKSHRDRIAPQTWSDHLYVEVDRSQIAMFKFILESYDNLAYLSVLDKYRAMVRLTFSPDATSTLHTLIHTLATTGEIAIRQVVHLDQSTVPSRIARQETS